MQQQPYCMLMPNGLPYRLGNLLNGVRVIEMSVT